MSVNGIGPKLAITVLSGLATRDLIESIKSADVARLVRIPGVGKKTAERIVLELKEKLSFAPGSDPAAPAAAPGPALAALDQDVLSALLNLGCARPAAEDAIRKAKAKPLDSGFEPLFRAALALVR
jgi:Holliday junction DNA helicase RuvA